MKFRKQPIKVDEESKLVVMTEEQAKSNRPIADDPKSAIGLMTIHGYSVAVCLSAKGHVFPYKMLAELLYFTLQTYQTKSEETSNHDKLEADTARISQIYNSLIPYIDTQMYPTDRLTQSEATQDGMTVLAKVLGMPTDARFKLIDKVRNSEGKDKIVVGGKSIGKGYLAEAMRGGAILYTCNMFAGEIHGVKMTWDEVLLAINGFVISYLLEGCDLDDALQNSYVDLEPFGFSFEMIKNSAEWMVP